MSLPFGRDFRVVVDYSIRASARNTRRSLVASTLGNWIQKVATEIKRVQLPLVFVS